MARQGGPTKNRENTIYECIGYGSLKPNKIQAVAPEGGTKLTIPFSDLKPITSHPGTQAPSQEESPQVTQPSVPSPSSEQK